MSLSRRLALASLCLFLCGTLAAQDSTNRLNNCLLGSKFLDSNNNGIRDSGEPFLAGVTINIWLNGADPSGPPTRTVVTVGHSLGYNSNWLYQPTDAEFAAADGGEISYVVREQPLAPNELTDGCFWVQTAPAANAQGVRQYSGTLCCFAGGLEVNNVYNLDFGNYCALFPPGTIGNCTLTIGYWKTHAGFNGKNGDDVTEHLPLNLGTGLGKSVLVTTAAQAVALLEKSGKASNGINKLYAQLLAAKLNQKNGADSTPEISAIIAAADVFLAANNAANWDSLSKAQKQGVNAWASALDAYNNGVTGPGHCPD